MNILKPIQSKEEYQSYVDDKTPNSPSLKNCFNAFWVGGVICSIGQIIFEVCQMRGIDETNSYTIVSMLLILCSAFLTVLNIFNKIGKFFGKSIKNSSNQFIVFKSRWFVGSSKSKMSGLPKSA